MIRFFARLMALATFAMCAVPAARAQSTTQYTNTTSAAINDNSCINQTFTVGATGTVTDVNIGVALLHTYRSDLQITLFSPGNTTSVSLMSANGGSGDNLSDLFDDSAATAISSHNTTTNDSTAAVPPYSHSSIPLSSLSAFNGISANGTWTLRICDTANVDTGTFTRADLYITAGTVSAADLSLASSLSNSAPATGSSITYTLTVANSATSALTANSVVVRAALPTGLSFVSATGSGSYSSATGDWTVGTLAPGQNATLTITAVVTANAGTSVTTTAEVTSSSATDSDSTPNNGVTSEDDYTSRTLTANSTRSAGIAPSLTCAAGTSLFDWDTQAWTAGSTANNYTLTGIGAFNFAITNPATFLNNAALGGQSPARQATVTGGLGTAQNSLAQLVDMTSNSQVVTTTISLGTAIPGAQFSMFDVDYGASQFADKVTVTGYLNGVAVYPTLTNGVSNYVIGNSAYGDGASADASANGNVVVTFTQAIDQIVIQYGNHSLAPANPGQQAITIHDFTLCKPVANIGVTKVSMVLSDPVNGSSFPKAIPGAVIEYCILIANNGTSTLTNISASDTLPTNFTYSAGTMTSGSSCAAATTAEDDNNIGTDETDPFGASITGTALSATAGSLTAGSSFALKFRGTVN